MENLEPIKATTPSDTVSGRLSQLPEVDERAYDVNPTERQKLAFEIFMENLGKISYRRAMLRAGYELNTADNPKNLTESEGWKILCDRYLPDEFILEKHTGLLNAKRKIRRFKQGELEEEIEEEDTFAVVKALQLAYQVKGKLIERKQIQGTLSIASLVAEVKLTDTEING